MLEFQSEPGIEIVGVFFVRKKSGKLRMVVDARRSNAYFRKPRHTQLCTGAGLSSLWVAACIHVYMCHFHIQDAFYHFALPEELHGYFQAPALRACDAGLEEAGWSADDWVYPVRRAMLMGWNHAMALCQDTRRRILRAVAGGRGGPADFGRQAVSVVG